MLLILPWFAFLIATSFGGPFWLTDFAFAAFESSFAVTVQAHPFALLGLAFRVAFLLLILWCFSFRVAFLLLILRRLAFCVAFVLLILRWLAFCVSLVLLILRWFAFRVSFLLLILHWLALGVARLPNAFASI